MKIAIVKYNAGNLESVRNSLLRLGIEPVVTCDPSELKGADKVIFPGVGEALSAMSYLRGRKLDMAIRSLTQPVLAICLGMQLLCGSSEENGTECLGILPHRVRRFPAAGLNVPHIGWNNISNFRSRLFEGIAENSRVYFVHSYFVEKCGHSTADASYGPVISAAVEHKNFYGVQFHPEKSGPIGAKVIENFLRI